MTPLKRFLLIYFGVYLAVAIVLNITLGPPGYSKAYLAEYKADQERYLDIIRHDDYKLWKENPELNPPDESLSERLKFVANHEGRQSFIREQRRRATYELLADVFNMAMVLLLVVWFGKGPLLAFLDGKITEMRDRIGEGEAARNAAARRKDEAQARMDGLESDRQRIASDNAERMTVDGTAVEQGTADALALIVEETRDRKRQEELAARRLVKQELVDDAIKLIGESYKWQSEDGHAEAYIDQFVAELEGVEKRT